MTTKTESPDYEVIGTASGYAVRRREDGKCAEFLDSSEASDVCHALNIGEDAESFYEWK